LRARRWRSCGSPPSCWLMSRLQAQERAFGGS
jgi:hypothetical protein